jgi:glucose/arabinose dehydrogenase/PKD repeat protein
MVSSIKCYSIKKYYDITIGFLIDKFSTIMGTKALFFCIAFFYYLSNIQSQTLPPDFTLATIGYGWNQPVGAVFTPDGSKIFVWEKAGKVYVCKRDVNGNYAKQGIPVLDISEEVGDWRDHGMIGFALDPQFATNGLIYISYVVDRHHLMNFGTPSYSSTTDEYYSATIGRVTRYQTITSGNDLLTAYNTRTILLGETKETGLPILYESHGIGGLLFAADGTLLVTGGDGASYLDTDTGSLSHTYYQQALNDGIIRPQENVGAYRSQMINSLCGKLLRINPENGNGLPSNPFYLASNPRAPRSRVWTLGLRNPFRFTIKPGTGSTIPNTGDIGEIYIGDVQWGLWEELSIVNEPGVNCGWPLSEGNTLYEYFGSNESYYLLNTRNLDEPNPLFGVGGCTQEYFTFRNLFKQATADNNKTVYNPCNTSQPIGTGNRYYHHRPSLDWWHQGNVARVPIFNGNNDPDVSLVGTQVSGVTGSPFKGNASVAGCWYTGTLFPVNYQNTYLQADYGSVSDSGSWIKSITVEYTDVVKKVENLASGFTALVCITQNPIDGTIVVVDIGDNNVKEIGYGGNYLPVAKMSANNIYGPSTLNVNFTGTNSYDNDGSIVAYEWNFGDNTALSTTPNPSHSFTAPPNTPTKYVVKLKVTDNLGGTSIDSMIISVNNTPPNVNITSPIKNSTYRVGADSTYECIATVTDAEHSQAQLTYEWQTFLRHNSHQHAEKIINSTSPLAVISRIGCNGDDYYWMIKLTVTDAAGLSTIDSSRIYPACQQIPLPIVLRSFSVTKQDHENLVKWTTELEYNVDYFEVERCQDGVNYLPIHKQQARNLSNLSTYSFIDDNFAAGVNYYRLKIVETDGKVRYSMIIKVSSEKGNSNRVVIAPNPVKDILSILYSTGSRGMAVIRISDINGRYLTTLRQIVNEGENVIYVETKPTWPSGTYFITVQKGDQILRSKFIKAK